MTCVKWFTILGFLFGGVLSISAQSVVHVTNYTKDEYRAGNQNWDISLDSKGNVFVANNNGLLVFDGAKWNINRLPVGTIIRSVAQSGNKVFTGSFEEIGYWVVDSINSWKYNTLTPLIEDIQLHNDEFWRIVEFQNEIYFQSFGSILVYDYKSIKSLTVPNPVLFLIKANNRLFVQEINGELFELINHKLKSIAGSKIFRDTEIKAIIPLDSDRYLIGTSSKGVYLYNGFDFTEWKCEYFTELKESKINTGIRAGNKLVFGTILKGLYIYDLNGNLISHQISNANLQNNTVLALKSDNVGNLWVGMDKGIDYLSFNSPIELYEDKNMSSGSVYTACIFNKELYVGTNQGVFYYSINSKDGRFTEKRFLTNSQGQVWFLKVIDDKLFCGLNNGTYIIEDHKLKQISNISGGYNLKKITWFDKEYLIQSTYSSVVVYSSEKEKWKVDRIIRGLIAPFRYLEIDYLGNIWLGHTVKGLFLVQPSGGLDSAISIKKVDSSYGISDFTNKIFKVDNRIIFPSDNHFNRWDDLTGKVIPFDELNQQLDDFKSSSSVVPISNNKYWFIKKNEIGMFDVLFGKAKLMYRLIPEMYHLNLVDNYENIVSLNDSLNLICLDNGFAILNIYSLNQLKEVNDAPVIKDVYSWNKKGRRSKVALNNDLKVRLSNSSNNISISFSSNEPVGQRKYYQYKLEGIDNTWSEWSYSSEVSYTRLPYGNYTFWVHTLNSKGIKTKSAKFVFRINPPWYISIYSFIIYAFILVVIALLLRLYVKKRFRQQKEFLIKKEQEKIRLEKEKAEQILIKLSNEKLQADISHANSQLANNTISLIKKNELLIEIKEQLENLKKDLGYRIPNKYYDSIYSLIEQNITSDYDWAMFEKLFDQAHENFFKRLKTDYTDLTPSDLRLCAYLRLNLSSKEIAPLINISVRGVEERRYRLRKRLNLLSDQNLTDFILSY